MPAKLEYKLVRCDENGQRDPRKVGGKQVGAVEKVVPEDSSQTDIQITIDEKNHLKGEAKGDEEGRFDSATLLPYDP